ncbi:hypothetical protein CYMTET_30459 [Cymbomonas tetramitiformis]|uniref:Uncharacterized protein n=1 Tax=Cymbomonas tetramitiformis TaxID=36881 RepID=A0AAE0FJ85_9CHLO|nr:hypothetical protein CYMTET_30459 [Cymbomonas tetramitiformis]
MSTLLTSNSFHLYEYRVLVSLVLRNNLEGSSFLLAFPHMSAGSEQDPDAGSPADHSASGRQTASADAFGIGGDYGDAASGFIFFVAATLGVFFLMFGFSLYKRFKIDQRKAHYRRKVRDLWEKRRDMVCPNESVPADMLPPTGTWSLRYKDQGGFLSEPVVKGGSCVLIFRDDGTIAGDGHDATGLYKLEGLYNCDTGVMHIGGTYPEMRGEKFISEMLGQGYGLAENKSKPPRMRPGKAHAAEIPQGGSDIHRIMGAFHNSAGLSGRFTLEHTGDVDFYKVDISGWDKELKIVNKPRSMLFNAMDTFTNFTRTIAKTLNDATGEAAAAAAAAPGSATLRRFQGNVTSLAGTISDTVTASSGGPFPNLHPLAPPHPSPHLLTGGHLTVIHITRTPPVMEIRRVTAVLVNGMSNAMHVTIALSGVIYDSLLVKSEGLL